MTHATHAATAQIEKSVTVRLDPMAAFDLFAAGIDRWWPKETHSLAARHGAGPDARVRIEPHEGGRVLEAGPDGTETPWADVTCYAPGERLTLRWYVGRSPDAATCVDVRFVPVEAGTKVCLAHSGFDVFGEAAAKTSANYATGWTHVLGTCFRRACDRIDA